MGIIYIDINFKQKKITKTAKNKLSWYDSDNKKITNYEGTRLDFRYDPTYIPNITISSSDYKKVFNNLKNFVQKQEEESSIVRLYIDEIDKDKIINYLISSNVHYEYKGKLKVSAIDISGVSYQSSSNHDEIIKWIEAHKEEYGLSILNIDNKTVAVNFEDTSKEEIEDSLYQERFNFEVL